MTAFTISQIVALQKRYGIFLTADINTLNLIFYLSKEYLKLLNRLYDITWFGSVYA